MAKESFASQEFAILKEDLTPRDMAAKLLLLNRQHNVDFESIEYILRQMKRSPRTAIKRWASEELTKFRETGEPPKFSYNEPNINENINVYDSPNEWYDQLAERFGEDTINSLLDNDSLKFVDRNEYVSIVQGMMDKADPLSTEYDEGSRIIQNAQNVQGFATSEGATLIYDNTNKNNGVAVFLHEMGWHFGIRNVDPKVLKNTYDSVEAEWKGENDPLLNELYNEVTQAYPKEHVNEEVLARILEHEVRRDDALRQNATGLTKFSYNIQKIIEKFLFYLRQALRKAGIPLKFNRSELLHFATSAAIVGSYAKEEAQQWIGEYMQDLCEALRGLDQQSVLALSPRIGISEDGIRSWYRESRCPQAHSGIRFDKR